MFLFTQNRGVICSQAGEKKNRKGRNGENLIDPHWITVKEKKEREHLLKFKMILMIRMKVER